MSALGIFIYGGVVMLFVGSALGLLAWGIVTEWQQDAIENAGSGEPAPEPAAMIRGASRGGS